MKLKGKRNTIWTLAVLLVLGPLFFLMFSLQRCSEQNSPEPNSPTTIYAPDNEGSYWNKERMESAVPAPMPTE